MFSTSAARTFSSLSRLCEGEKYHVGEEKGNLILGHEEERAIHCQVWEGRKEGGKESRRKTSEITTGNNVR